MTLPSTPVSSSPLVVGDTTRFILFSKDPICTPGLAHLEKVLEVQQGNANNGPPLWEKVVLFLLSGSFRKNIHRAVRR